LFEQCVVPENIHTLPPPTERELPYEPLPLGKFQFSFKIALNFWGLRPPSLPGIFNPLDLWGEYGYFLELHNGGY